MDVPSGINVSDNQGLDVDQQLVVNNDKDLRKLKKYEKSSKPKTKPPPTSRSSKSRIFKEVKERVSNAVNIATSGNCSVYFFLRMLFCLKYFIYSLYLHRHIHSLTLRLHSQLKILSEGAFQGNFILYSHFPNSKRHFNFAKSYGVFGKQFHTANKAHSINFSTFVTAAWKESKYFWLLFSKQSIWFLYET